MSKREDGGPAFPRPVAQRETLSGDRVFSVAQVAQAGMTLRDWFAGQALPSVAMIQTRQ